MGEKPRVVAYRKGLGNWYGALSQTRPSIWLDADELMTVAQHERIVAGLEADARRYRWLRDEAGETLDGPYIAGKQGAPFAGDGWLTGEIADAAVDAFLAQTAEEK